MFSRSTLSSIRLQTKTFLQWLPRALPISLCGYTSHKKTANRIMSAIITDMLALPTRVKRGSNLTKQMDDATLNFWSILSATSQTRLSYSPLPLPMKARTAYQQPH